MGSHCGPWPGLSLKGRVRGGSFHNFMTPASMTGMGVLPWLRNDPGLQKEKDYSGYEVLGNSS